jgi:signal transduction histidine kinase
MQQPEQMSVPVEAVAQAVADQRNAAMDQAAQWQAAALQLKAERDRLAADLEKLRAGQ